MYQTAWNRMVLLTGVAALVAVLAAPPARAGIFTLADTGQNSSLVIDTATGTMTDWNLEGIDQLAQRNYFFRVGGIGPELAVNTTNLNLLGENAFDVNFLPGNETLSVAYQDPMGKFRMSFLTSLTSAALGSNQATFTESVRIDNLSLSNLHITLFLYADYDLGGDVGDSLVQFSDPRTVTQTDAVNLVTHEAAVTVTPSAIEANTYPALLNSLGNGTATSLSGASSAANGDLEYALQWNLVIAPGRSFTIGSTQSVSVVPEASSLILAGCMMSVAGLAALRRRTSR